MNETSKQLVNALKVIGLLSSEGGRTLKQLTESLQASQSSVYRIKDTLLQIGFHLEKDPYTHRYKLLKHPKGRPIRLFFCQEEVDVILRALAQLPVEPTQLKRISDKLYVHSDLLTIPNTILEAQFGMHIARLQTAILEKRQVILRGYRSARSNTISDRLVEPLDMQDAYRRLYAYDPTRQDVCQYKLERIAEISLTDTPFLHAHRHRTVRTDVFWIDGVRHTPIELKLSLTAYELLKEEYPRIVPHTQQVSALEYVLHTEVVDFTVISSFILRIPGEVEVHSPPELKDYLRERIKKYTF